MQRPFPFRLPSCVSVRCHGRDKPPEVRRSVAGLRAFLPPKLHAPKSRNENHGDGCKTPTFRQCAADSPVPCGRATTAGSEPSAVPATTQGNRAHASEGETERAIHRRYYPGNGLALPIKRVWPEKAAVADGDSGLRVIMRTAVLAVLQRLPDVALQSVVGIIRLCFFCFGGAGRLLGFCA